MEIELFNLIFEGMSAGLGSSIIVLVLCAIAGIAFTLSVLRLDPLFAVVSAAFPFVLFGLYAGVEIYAVRFVVIALLSLIGAISISRLLFR